MPEVPICTKKGYLCLIHQYIDTYVGNASADNSRRSELKALTKNVISRNDDEYAEALWNCCIDRTFVDVCSFIERGNNLTKSKLLRIADHYADIVPYVGQEFAKELIYTLKGKQLRNAVDDIMNGSYTLVAEVLGTEAEKLLMNGRDLTKLAAHIQNGSYALVAGILGSEAKKLLMSGHDLTLIVNDPNGNYAKTYLTKD